MQGIVKFFNVDKGFGFISVKDSADHFVHFKEIKGEGFKSLREGQEVTFISKKGDKGLMATDVIAN